MRRRRTAHRFGDRRRTTDVLTEETLDFSGLMLSSAVLEGLKSAGFERPSPIQLKAIPLGRCGIDLIAQAKSGTGKTCVFSVIALENVNLTVASIQILILAPTREIAVQIKDVVCSIGRHLEGLCVHVFIGGMPIEEDKRHLKQCHIAVGTPGRVKQLIENKFLKPDAIRLFILDEADKLLDDNFQSQTNWIFSTLPVSKQMLALSATYTDHLAQHLRNYMKDPTFVRLNASDPALEGIRHYRSVVPYHSLPHQVFQEKVKTLLTLLSKLPFHQCLIFSNYQIRARNLSETLSKNGWPSTYIAGSQGQNERLKAMDKLKEFKCRILISTDLTSRGIDAERVNLVINMDVPRDSQTYLHRVGRAGRFGSYGAAVNFVAEGKEVASLNEIGTGCGVVIDLLPEDISQLLSEPVPCDGKQPISSVTTSIGIPEKAVGPGDGGITEGKAGFKEINGDTIETEGNADGEGSGKEEVVEMKVERRSGIDENGSSVFPEEEKEAFENGASAEPQLELFEEKPDFNKTVDTAGVYYKGITDRKLGDSPPGDVGEQSEDRKEVLAGKHDKREAKEVNCSAVDVEKSGLKELQQNPGCHVGTFGDKRDRRECLLENSHNGEHVEKCLSDTACFGVLREEGNLGIHGEDKEHVREHCDLEEHVEKYCDNKELLGEHSDTEEQLGEHCGNEEHIKECRDAEELLGERRETKEHFGGHWGTKEDHGERPHAKEHHEDQFDKTKHSREHCGTEEHLRDNRDSKGSLKGLCNNNVQLKMNDAATEFSGYIRGNEDEELQRREPLMPWEKLSKLEFSPAENGTGKFCEVERLDHPRSSENQSCVEPIIEEHLGVGETEGDFSENSLGSGTRNKSGCTTKLGNSSEFNGKYFDGSKMTTSPVIFRRAQTESASFGIESTELPSGLEGTESPCPEETGSKDSSFVGPRSENSCSNETGSERSCSGKTTSEGSISAGSISEGSISEDSNSEDSNSEETESESSGIERRNAQKNIPMSGEDFDNVLESYLQTHVSEKPIAVRKRSEELSENDVAVESWTPIEPASQSKGTKSSDGRTEAVSPIVINKPHAHQCTGIDQDENDVKDQDDVIETLPRVSRDAPSPDLSGLQAGEQGCVGAMFHSTTEDDDVSGYLSTLPAEWKRVWYEAYERQTKLISTYTKVYRDAFY